MQPHNFKNLVGKRFGRLTVKERSENNKFGEAQWLCECDCTNTTIVRTGDLNSGNTVSCGCHRKEKLIERSKKYNNYNLIDRNYGIGYTFKNEEFYFDLEDYNKIKDHCWCINKMGYLVALKPKTSTKMYMHRLIMDFPDKDKEIDHINKIKIDNRKINLRIVTHQENMINLNKKKSNTTGNIGVYEANNGNWIAGIGVSGKQITKTFEDKQDAIIQRLKWELEYFGLDFSPQRHLFKEYGII